MRPISSRCASVKPCACAGTAAMQAMKSAAAVERSVRRIAGSFGSVVARWRFKGDDVVGAHPAGRAGREAGLGAGGQIAGGAVVAAGKGGLGGGEVGLGEVALAAVGHGELAVAVGH